MGRYVHEQRFRKPLLYRRMARHAATLQVVAVHKLFSPIERLGRASREAPRYNLLKWHEDFFLLNGIKIRCLTTWLRPKAQGPSAFDIAVRRPAINLRVRR